MVSTGLPPPQVQPEVILAAVAHAFDVPLEVIITSGRRRDPGDARPAAMILLADLCHLTFAEIGRLLGDCDPTVVEEALAQKESLLLNPVWAGCLGDAAEDVTGIRPAEPPRVRAYQGYPVLVVEEQARSVLLRFIGRPPPGLTRTTRVSRDILEPAPELGTAARALEDYLMWARPLIETGQAWPDLVRQARVAEHALSTLVRETLPTD